MSKIEWKEEYELGVEEIDFEHRIFVKIIHKIDDAVVSGKDSFFINRLLLELKKYAQFHFQSEENIMIEKKFPLILKHKAQHEHLLSQLQLVLLKVEIGEDKIEELPHFLLNWFKNHTLEEDKKLADFL